MSEASVKNIRQALLMKSLRHLLDLRQYLLKQNTSALLAKRQRKHDEKEMEKSKHEMAC